MCLCEKNNEIPCFLCSSCSEVFCPICCPESAVCGTCGNTICDGCTITMICLHTYCSEKCMKEERKCKDICYKIEIKS